MPALALAIALAAVLVVLALAVVFFLTGFFAIWMVWAAAGWWVYGRRGRGYTARHRRPMPPGAYRRSMARAGGYRPPMPPTASWHAHPRGPYRRGARL